MSRYPVAIPPHTQILRIERRPTGWMLWIHNDPAFEHGTYLWLGNDGAIDNITERPHDVQSFNVKPPDAELEHATKDEQQSYAPEPRK